MIIFGGRWVGWVFF